MSLLWTRHRFSGGLLALDLVNTIVCRGDDSRREDRLTGEDRLRGFAAAAGTFRADECIGGVPADGSLAGLNGLREAINDWVRPQPAESGSRAALSRLFAAASAAIAADSGGFALDVARSAMRLIDPALRERVKSCPNCDWLFVDRSRNRSRLWCDMAVCGNRAKASKHYRRHRAATAGQEGADR